MVQGVFKASESNGWDVSGVSASEVRIVLLYCTQAESTVIMDKAAKAGLTGAKYLWMATQSVVGDTGHRSSSRRALPTGMLGE